MNRIEYELNKQFPNKVISNFSSKYSKLYSYTFNEMRKTEYQDMSEFLKSMGFQYVKHIKDIEGYQKVINMINAIYPDKIVLNLSSNKDLYSDVFLLARGEGSSIKDLLSKNGFVYKLGYSSKVNVPIAKELKNIFGYTFESIGRIFDVKRQRIEQKLKDSPDSEDSKVILDIDAEDEMIIEMMIQDRIFSFMSDNAEIRIINDRNGNVGILRLNDFGINLLSNDEIPESLLINIRNSKMDILDEADFKILDKCKSIYVQKKEYLLTSFLNKEIYAAAKRHNMTLDEYCILLGYNGSKTNKCISDDRIIDFLESNLIDTKVYISSSPTNQWIRSYVSRETQLSLKEFVEFYGYEKADRDFESEFEDTKSKYQNRLQQYIVDSTYKDQIYLPSNSLDYKNIYALCLKRGLVFDDFLLELGFKRINQAVGPIIHEELLKSDAYYKNIATRLSNKIKNFLENDKKRELVEFEIRKRNRALVDELKSLYSYRCQLCHDESIPPIVTVDGKNYVEVHHIKPLSEEKYDEEEDLDVLENMIVVCPHHHKFLHYNRGGYKTLTFEGKRILLLNEYGESAEVYLNYHLDNQR